MELIQGDLEKWSRNALSEEQWVGFIFQMMFSLLTIQKYLKICHNDLHWGNVLVHEYKYTDSYILYKYKNQEFYVPFYGQLYLISDFGFASQLRKDDNMVDIRRISHVAFWIKKKYNLSSPILDLFKMKASTKETLWELILDMKSYLRQATQQEQVVDVYEIDSSFKRFWRK
jgi:predicted unusual protein kinase regulating ubiquinone biosynthesis (AarF/ABC1/UbiB family)